MSVLDEILANTRRELDAARTRVPDEAMAARARARAEPARGFRRALASGPGVRVVAEIKRRSPSRGALRPDLEPVDFAKAYADAGAAALSVLTDARYFGGSLEDLDAARRACALPVLRKDFTLEAYQVDEARAWGADAVLLIAAALGGDALAALHERALALGMDALVEVHDEGELERALAAGARLVGINNRDLRSFETDLRVTERLAPRVPESTLVVAESGIFGPEERRRLERAGARAFLVGESLVRQPDPGRALRELRGTS